MKYKLEIMADDVTELMFKARKTIESVRGDADFIERIESKGMKSCFFTRHANILVIDENKDEEDD